MIAQPVFSWEVSRRQSGKSANRKVPGHSYFGCAPGVCIKLPVIGAQWSSEEKEQEEKGKMKGQQTLTTDPTPPPHLPQPHEHKQVTWKTAHFSHPNKALARCPRSSLNKNKRVTTGWVPIHANFHRAIVGKRRNPWRASAVSPTAGG
jgi:hypothetical protein